MSYNTYKRKKDKDGKHKDSPAKFLNALFGGPRRRREQEAANEDFEAHKGSKSKTHKGDHDFTTKKGSKDFHEDGKDVKKKRKPYTKRNV